MNRTAPPDASTGLRLHIWLAVLAAGLPACNPGAHVAELEIEVTRLQQERSQLLATIGDQDKKIEVLSQTLAKRVDLGDKAINKLYCVDHIEVGNPSGGWDFDNTPGDDGLVLYLKLYDQDGDALKAAGDIDVDIYELADPPKRVAHCGFGVDEARGLWYGRFLTYHYRLACAWQQRPSGRAVTARVTFLDYLTGKVFQTTRQLEITPALPAPTPPREMNDRPAKDPSQN